MTEEWRDVPGYSGTYQVSSFGNVRSSGGKFLRGSRVDLYRDGRRDNRSVAELVMQVFGESPPEPGLRILHRDGDKGNSRISNLHWDGRSASRPGEEWCDIPGYEGYYEASTLGRIRSRKQAPPAGRPDQGLAMKVVLSPRVGTGGYGTVNLHRPDAPLRMERVHVLIAETFHGPRPDGCFVLHSNGDPSDNRAENLRWGTPLENIHDMLKHTGHYRSRIERCPRGHLLRAPNLRASVTRSSGRRECQSCYSAFMWRSYRVNGRGDLISDEQLWEFAHEKYREFADELDDADFFLGANHDRSCNQ